jgi:hypothetical protein
VRSPAVSLVRLLYGSSALYRYTARLPASRLANRLTRPPSLAGDPYPALGTPQVSVSIPALASQRGSSRRKLPTTWKRRLEQFETIAEDLK